MGLKKVWLVVLLAIVAALGAGGFLLARGSSGKTNGSADTPVSSTDMSDEGVEMHGPQFSASDQDSEAAEVEEIQIDIRNYVFTPETITIKAGTKVTWTNRDSVGHDVVPDTETSEFRQSKMLRRGESYSVTFDTPGIYTYFCSPHPYMKGKIVVAD